MYSVFKSIFFFLFFGVQGCFNQTNKGVAPGSELKLTLPSGWEVNADAPSFLELKTKGKEGQFKIWKKEELRNTALRIPEINGPQGQPLLLSGKVFYCEKTNPSVCKVKNIELELNYDSSINASKVSLDLEALK